MRYLLGIGHQVARGNLSGNWAAFPAEHAIHQVVRGKAFPAEHAIHLAAEGTRYLSGLSGNCVAYAIHHWAVLEDSQPFPVDEGGLYLEHVVHEH